MADPNPHNPTEFRPIPFLLGWILPGLGHAWIGERRRGLLVAIALLGMGAIGVLVGGVDVVDRREDHLWFLPQALLGPVTLGADLVNQTYLKTGRVGEIIDHERDPRSEGTVPINAYKSLGRVNELGTLYVALAGLMNLYAMIDAATRPPRPRGERDPFLERRRDPAEDAEDRPATRSRASSWGVGNSGGGGGGGR